MTVDHGVPTRPIRKRQEKLNTQKIQKKYNTFLDAACFVAAVLNPRGQLMRKFKNFRKIRSLAEKRAIL